MKLSYKVGDKVQFKIDNIIQNGTIYVIDHGSIEFPEETTYDIMGENEIFYKKVHEKQINKFWV